MTITFIVLTYNRTDTLLAVLRSLAKQCNKNHQIVIADDGSNLDHVQRLFDQCAEFKCPVLHVWHPDVGFTIARARNLAASHATGEYLVFLDGDCIPNRNFVARHERLAEAGYFVNGSRVLLSQQLTAQVLADEIDLSCQPASFWLRARLSGNSNKLLHLVGWPFDLFRAKKNFQWKGIRGCNLGVWKQDFSSINGFDESFEGWGHEDADFVLRLSHLGIRRKNGFLATEVFHLWHPESKRNNVSENKNRVVARMKTNLILADKGFRELDAAENVESVKLTQLH